LFETARRSSRSTLGDGYRQLHSRVNGGYVTAEDGGNKPLIANRTAIGVWESSKKSKLVVNPSLLLSVFHGVGVGGLLAYRVALGWR
jgi:hypothetical protein